MALTLSHCKHNQPMEFRRIGSWYYSSKVTFCVRPVVADGHHRTVPVSTIIRGDLDPSKDVVEPWYSMFHRDSSDYSPYPGYPSLLGKTTIVRSRNEYAASSC
jgi:hypothetical protein